MKRKTTKKIIDERNQLRWAEIKKKGETMVENELDITTVYNGVISSDTNPSNSNIKKLAIISAKDPNCTLYLAIHGLKEYYPDFDIVVIDSDSTETYMYEMIKEDVKAIHLSKNHNFEVGAYKIGYELYPHYDIYLCMQDGIIPKKQIFTEYISDNDQYAILSTTCPPVSGNYIDKPIGINGNVLYPKLPELDDILLGSTYEQDYVGFDYDKDSLVAHNTFLVSKSTLKKFISEFGDAPTGTKNCSGAFEVVLAMFLNRHCKRRFDMLGYFNKIYRNRL